MASGTRNQGAQRKATGRDSRQPAPRPNTRTVAAQPGADTELPELAFQALHDIAVAVGGILNPTELAKLVVQRARELLRANASTLRVWDAETGLLRMLASIGERGNLPPDVRPGQGASGVAFQQGRPVIVADYATWDHALPVVVPSNVAAAVAVPLLLNERALGSLTVRAHAPRAFTSPEVQLLSLLAAQVTPALEAARLYNESEHRRVQAEALAGLVREGTLQPDPRQVINLATEEACRLLQADYAAVALYEAGGALTWHGVSGNRTDVWRQRLSPAQGGSLGKATATGRTVIADHLGENPEFPWESMPVHQAEGGRTALGTPLAARGSTIGGLVVGWRRDQVLTEEQVRLAEALAGYAATIIDNARAHAEAQTRTKELDSSLRQLAATQERLQAVYQAVSCGVLVRDRSGAIIHANGAAEKIFGVSAEAMRGRTRARPLWKLEREDGSAIGVEDHPSAIAVHTGKEVRNLTMVVERPDGERKWIQVESVPVFDSQGTVEQVVSSFIDVSARIEAETALKRLNAELDERVAERTAELQAANDELETFSYSVAHDLRAPLRSMDGFCQMLLEEYREQLDDNAKHYLDRVRAGSQRMAQLMDDLLRLARVSRTEMRRERVDLSGMARGIAHDLQAREPGRFVAFDIPDDVVSYGDRRLLRLMLENLLENAWKFTSKHPTGHIEFGRSEVDSQPRFFVRDDGAGFDMAYADKLFEPFQRLHGATEFEGTGIGLATARRIITRHGGRVWGEGEVERGACFYFSL
ncbi:MAG TPA: GAF domain-containing protein [Chloroflexota bacterium]|nr:GAF domain-containing protein [Chloroflexota bacterium]